MLPVLPEHSQEGHAHAGECQVQAAAQEWRGELGGRGDTHEEDGDDGQHDVNTFSQEDLGIGVRR